MSTCPLAGERFAGRTIALRQW